MCFWLLHNFWLGELAKLKSVQVLMFFTLCAVRFSLKHIQFIYRFIKIIFVTIIVICIYMNEFIIAKHEGLTLLLLYTFCWTWSQQSTTCCFFYLLFQKPSFQRQTVSQWNPSLVTSATQRRSWSKSNFWIMLRVREKNCWLNLLITYKQKKRHFMLTTVSSDSKLL